MYYITFFLLVTFPVFINEVTALSVVKLKKKVVLISHFGQETLNNSLLNLKITKNFVKFVTIPIFHEKLLVNIKISDNC